MRILLVNRYDYPGYGAENYFINLCRLLKEKDHEVIVFTTKDQMNIDQEYSDYYINKIDLDNLSAIPFRKKINSAFKTIYSTEARKKIEQLITYTHPDLVHIHSIKRLISPSILHSVKKFGLPVVYTLNDYHLFCPNYRLFVKGKICDACRGNRYYNAFLKKCIRDSFSLSLLACLEQYVHNNILRILADVDMFIAPSIFMREKMADYGLVPGRLTNIPYFIPSDDYASEYEYGDYIVYFGRIVQEKGVFTLIKAMQTLSSIRLIIIGEGSNIQELEDFVAKNKMKNVEFKYYVQHRDLRHIVGNSSLVVVPSEWNEVLGLVILESFALGRPVIGADIGGIPEVIDDGQDGILFKPGDVADLAKKIDYLYNNKNKIVEMGNNGRRKVLEFYSPGVHYERILQVYYKLTAK